VELNPAQRAQLRAYAKAHGLQVREVLYLALEAFFAARKPAPAGMKPGGGHD
jgi:hypothetical protein